MPFLRVHVAGIDAKHVDTVAACIHLMAATMGCSGVKQRGGARAQQGTTTATPTGVAPKPKCLKLNAARLMPAPKLTWHRCFARARQADLRARGFRPRVDIRGVRACGENENTGFQQIPASSGVRDVEWGEERAGSCWQVLAAVDLLYGCALRRRMGALERSGKVLGIPHGSLLES